MSFQVNYTPPPQPVPEYLPALLAIIPLILIAVIWEARRRWDRLAVPFRTRQKVRSDRQDDPLAIQIDGRNFRKLHVIPTTQGLYLSHWGGVPMLFMPKRILIPWTSMSDLYSVERSALGFKVSEYFVDTRGASRVTIKLPRDVAEDILQRGFLQGA